MDKNQEVSVFQGIEVMARMVVLRLDSHGIEAGLVGLSYGGPASHYLGGGDGLFDVVVLEKHAERALEILNEETES